MTVLFYVLGFAAIAYLLFFSYRMLKQIWNYSLEGEIYEARDAFKMFLGDVWKVVTLPYVAWKAYKKA